MTAEDFRVALARLKKNYKQIADELGVYTSTTARWGNGERPIPKMAVIIINGMLKDMEERRACDALESAE